jgi:hypothetical protein
MRHFQQCISQIPPFDSANIMAAQILDVEAISLVLPKHSFYAYNTTFSPLMDLLYIVKN